MNLYGVVARYAFRLMRDDRFALLDTQREHLFWERTRLLDNQISRLRAILSWAYENTKFYHDVFHDLGRHPNDLELPRDLELLPVLKREHLQKQLVDLTSRCLHPNHRRLVSSGGSTGEPVKVWWDKRGWQEGIAAQYRAYELVEAPYGSKWLKIVGGLRHIREGRGVKARLHDILSNRRTIIAFDLDDHSVERWVSEIKRHRPEVIFGYGGHIGLLGEYLRQHPDRLGVRVILFGGEALPNYRDYEPIFGCPVIQTYATREVGVIAFECPERNMHISEDTVYLETILDETGGFHRLLVTSMINRATPLIRYEIGDCGQILPPDCSCGIPFRRLSLDIGRTPHYIRLANGRMVTHLLFAHALKDFPVSRYQVLVQEKRRIIINVLSKATSEEEPHWIAALTSRIASQVGNDIEVMVTLSNNWHITQTGKIPIIVEC